MNHIYRRYYHLVAGVISLGIILPVFFQIKGGIFRDSEIVLDSAGSIYKLPIPLSVLACFIGILLLIRLYKNAVLSFIVVIVSVILMSVSMLIMTGGQYKEIWCKSIILLQFVLPMFALILGQLYEKIDEKLVILSKVFFIVLCIIATSQLICSLLSVPINSGKICYYLYIFSIYQHIQYVPLVFSSAFLLVLMCLGDNVDFKKWITLFLPLMTIYVVVTNSLVSIFLLLLGVISYAFFHRHLKKGRNVKLMGLIILTTALIFGYMYYYGGLGMIQQKFKENKIGSIEMPGFENRLHFWEYYGKAVTKDIPTFFMGNKKIPDRSQYPSAHNYYLDFMYHFGFFSIFPLLTLIGATLYGIYRNRKVIATSPELMGIVIVVLYLLFVDNMLKVGMRQPYPGIFTFFLWGNLLSKLLKESNQFATTATIYV